MDRGELTNRGKPGEPEKRKVKRGLAKSGEPSCLKL